MFTKKILVLFMLMVVLAACNPQKPSQSTATTVPANQLPTKVQIKPTNTAIPATATNTVTPTETMTPTAEVSLPSNRMLKNYPKEGYGPSGFPANINPLTGLPVTDPSILDRHPVAVKVSIIPRRLSRPPWGISKADIVFDYYHNNGYTRFHAIFYGQNAELVGPVRSARLLDDILIRAYKTVFAYGSADPRINRKLFNAPYSNRLALEGSRHNCPPTVGNPFCRYDPNGTDILLIDTQALTEYMAKNRKVPEKRQYLDGYYFNLIVPENGITGKQVFTRYSGDSYNRWDYDPASNRYLRFQDNVFDQGQGEEYAPMVDRLTNEQIGADNVVILFAKHSYYYKTATSEIVRINLNGYGKAIVFRDGKAFKVNWARPKSGEVVFLTYDDGSRFPLHPGVTWFQVVGTSSKVAQEENGIWRFGFMIP